MNGTIGNDVFCVRYSQDNKYLAAGTANGSIKLYNSNSGHLVSTMIHGIATMPITCVK